MSFQTRSQQTKSCQCQEIKGCPLDCIHKDWVMSDVQSKNMRMIPTDIHDLWRVFKLAPRYVLNQMSAPQTETFKISKKKKKASVCFSQLALCWALGCNHVSLHKPLKSHFSVHCTLWVLWTQAPLAFKARFLGACLLGIGLKAEVPDVGFKPFSPQKL